MAVAAVPSHGCDLLRGAGGSMCLERYLLPRQFKDETNVERQVLTWSQMRSEITEMLGNRRLLKAHSRGIYSSNNKKASLKANEAYY